MKTPHRIPLTGIICITLLSSHALAQFSQQGPKLVGSGAVENAQQGSSVSLSADGNTAIIGGSSDNSNTGAAWVWVRSGGVWSQQAKLVGAGAVGSARQGAVSLSADGNTAIVGGPGDNSNAGAAWVFIRTGGIWTQQFKLVGSGAIGAASQGVSVSLSADGNTTIVGGSADNSGAGAAWIWTRSGGIWTQQFKIVGSGAVGNAGQGFSVSLSADGNTAIIGGRRDNSNAGAAWIWIRSGGIWTQQIKLVGSGAVGNAFQGFSVSLAADGNTAIVGGPDDNGLIGAAWVFTRTGGLWAQQSKLVGAGAIGHANQGWSAALSSDGNMAIVGGPIDDDELGICLDCGGGPTGAAWVWTRNGAVWNQGSKLVVSDYVLPIAQGYSVSLSADASTAISGGPYDSNTSGAAFVFVRSSVNSASIPAVSQFALMALVALLALAGVVRVRS